MAYNDAFTKMVGDTSATFKTEITAVQDNVTEEVGAPVLEAGKYKAKGDLNAIIQEIINNDVLLKVIADKLRLDLDSHANNKNNPHVTTKEQIGLGNVENYDVTSSVSDPSNKRYATAGAVKTAYDMGDSALKATDKKLDRGEYIGDAHTLNQDTKSRLPYVSTIEELKKQNKYVTGDVVVVLGYYTAGDGGGHPRQKKPADYAGADAVIGVDGSIWGIVHNGEVSVSWFGFKDGNSIDNILSYAYKEKVKLRLSTGNHIFTKLKLTSETNIVGLQDSSFLLYRGNETSAISREDNNLNVIGAQLRNLTITTATNGSGGAAAQEANKDKFGLNLFGCNYSVIENVSISGFGLGALKFGRCENGAENEGFINTTKDGNYNTLTNVRFSSCGKYGVGAIDFKYKANSNNLYSIYVKGGIDKAVVFTYGGNNNVFGGTIESVTDCVTFEDLAQRNNCYGIRMEGFTNGYITRGTTPNFPNSVINPYFSTGTSSFMLEKELIVYSELNSSINVNTLPTQNLSRDLSNIPTNINYITSTEDDTVNILAKKFGQGYPKLRMFDTKTNPNVEDILSERLFKTIDSSDLGARDTLKERISYIDTLGNVSKREIFYKEKGGVAITYSDYRGLSFMPLNSNLSNKPIDGLYWNFITNSFEMYVKGVVTPNLKVLDTPYHASNMQKLGILDAYRNYLTELHEYEKSQKDLADSEIVTLKVLQPPTIPKGVEGYAKEYSLI